jgi:hypothetical protein
MKLPFDVVARDVTNATPGQITRLIADAMSE